MYIIACTPKPFYSHDIAKNNATIHGQKKDQQNQSKKNWDK